MAKTHFKSLFLGILVIFSVIFQSVHLWHHAHENTSSSADTSHSKKMAAAADDFTACSICHFSMQTNDCGFHPDLIPARPGQLIETKIQAADQSVPQFRLAGLFRLRAPPVLS